MVKFTIDMDRVGKHLSDGTKQLSTQAAYVAHTAAASIVAGLRTCDERSGGDLKQFEIRIGRGDSEVTTQQSTEQNKRSGFANLAQTISIPSTAFSLTPDTSKPFVGDTWGNYSFKFSFELVTTGKLTGYLLANAHSEEGQNLPLLCRWKRKIGGAFFDILNASGTKYPISADDVGSKICIEAKISQDPNSSEVAYGEMGIFELDPATRRNLDNYLALGGTEFPITFANPERTDAELNTELMCHVTATEVKIIKPALSSIGFVENWSCKYGADYPLIVIPPNDLLGLHLHLSASKSLLLTAMTRSQRDLMVLTIRCFHGRQYLANSLLLQSISHHAGKQMSTLMSQENKTGTQLAEPQMQNLTIDYFVLLQQLTSEAHRSLHVAEKSVKERDRAETEKLALEHDMTATINAYQQFLDQAGVTANVKNFLDTDKNNAQDVASEITQRAAYVAEVETKLKESRTQCEKYLDDLERLRREHNNLRKLYNESTENYRVPKSFSPSKHQSIPRLSKELSQTVDDAAFFNSPRMSTKDLDIDCEVSKFITQPRMNEQFSIISVEQNTSQQNTRRSCAINKSVTQGLGTIVSESSKLLVQIAELKQELSAAREEIETLITTKNRQQKQMQSLSRALEKADKQFKALLDLNKQLDGGKTMAESQIQKLKEEALTKAALTEELDYTKQQLNELKKERGKQQSIIEELKAENQIFRSKIRKMAAA